MYVPNRDTACIRMEIRPKNVQARTIDWVLIERKKNERVFDTFGEGLLRSAHVGRQWRGCIPESRWRRYKKVAKCVQSCSFARSNPATEIALRYPFLKNVNYKIPQFKHILAGTFLTVLLKLLLMLFLEITKLMITFHQSTFSMETSFEPLHQALK